MIDIISLQQALEASWGEDTHQSPKGWSLNNPAQGQCCVSSMIVRDFFGGTILRGTTNRGTVHYWNTFGGAWYDSTRSQFGSGEYIELWRMAWKSEYIFTDTLNKADILRGRVDECLDQCEIPL